MEKIEVNIHFLIGGTIKRTYCSRSTSTFRDSLVGKSNQRWTLIILLHLRAENLIPHIIRTVEYPQCENFQLFVFIHPGWINYLSRFTGCNTVHHLNCLKRVLSQEQSDDGNNYCSEPSNGSVSLSSSLASPILEIGFAIVPVDPLHTIIFNYFSVFFNHSSTMGRSYPSSFAFLKSALAATLSN